MSDALELEASNFDLSVACLQFCARADGILYDCWDVASQLTTPVLSRPPPYYRNYPACVRSVPLRCADHGRVGGGGRRRRLPAGGTPTGLRPPAIPRRRRCERVGDWRQLHQVHGHRRVPGGGRGRVRAGEEVGRQDRRRARLRRRLLPRCRHGRLREVHAGDDDPATDGRAVLGQGDGELRGVLEGHRRVHGGRGRRRGEVQGGVQAGDVPAGRVHPLHPLARRSPHRGVLQGLVGAGGRRRGDREQAPLRGRAGVHHRGARRLAGREAEHRGEGVGAPQGGQSQPGRRRAAGGARPGLRVSGQRARKRGKRKSGDRARWHLLAGLAGRCRTLAPVVFVCGRC